MTSTRLPGKVLLPVKEQPLLKYHTDRLRQSGYPVFLTTTTNATDEALVQFARMEGLDFYRGDENNVLSRYYETALAYNLDIIVRVTSDCPLIDGNLIKSGVQQYLQKADDRLYLSNTVVRTFPRGLDFEIFSFVLLQEAAKAATEAFQKEHVTPYIKTHASNADIINPVDASNFRITVDTPEDFDLVKVLIEKFAADKLGYTSIIHLLQNNPELAQINAHIEQKKI
ncbi:glycosyltransferase family protein [Adhaeribacter swui]|uniref:Glycosyltransferase family protein n=2 Tax=Adhaeribacter swui TaxID=2086471 RepID=A0A7G7GFC8_9BACT|nr:glycosyltransferase family protein [Adhaeribacter swui]